MNEAATDVIIARSRQTDRLTTMVGWSVGAHLRNVEIVPRPNTDEVAPAEQTPGE